MRRLDHKVARDCAKVYVRRTSTDFLVIIPGS